MTQTGKNILIATIAIYAAAFLSVKYMENKPYNGYISVRLNGCPDDSCELKGWAYRGWFLENYGLTLDDGTGVVLFYRDKLV